MADSKVSEILNEIKGLSVLELNELVKACEEEFGVSAAATVVAPGGAAGGGGEEKTEFNVVLVEVGPSKMNVIKAVREITSLGLKDAKELVDNVPKAIKENVPEAEAKEIQKKFEEIKAKVELK